MADIVQAVMWLILALVAAFFSGISLRVFLAILIAGPNATDREVNELVERGPLRRFFF